MENNDQMMPLDKITLDHRLMIRIGLDGDTISRYQEIIAELPPVVVFHDGGTYWLADGFHRYHARRLADLGEIAVVVHKGTFNDALEHAAIANTQHGRNLTSEEYKTATLALKQVHPEWSSRDIGKALNRDHVTILNYLNAEEVRMSGEHSPTLSDRKLREIHSAPSEQWRPIIEAAEREEWSAETIHDVVKEIKAPEASPEQVEALLSGEGVPFVKENGEIGVRPEVLARGVKKALDNDALLQFEKWLTEFSRIKIRFNTDDIVGSMDDKRVEIMIGELPQIRAFLDGIEDIGRQKIEFLGLLDR